MPLPISESIPALKSRVEFILQRELPTYCTARSTADHPTPSPEARAYIIGRTASLDEAYEEVGNPDVVCMISVGTSRLENPTANLADYNQVTPVTVAIFLRRALGADLPTLSFDHGGGNIVTRDQSMREWMEERAEVYRGILLDVCPKFLPDGENIHQVALESAGVSDPIRESGGIYREAGMRFEATQHVTAQTPIYT